MGEPCKDWPWAHIPAPWRAPVLLHKLRPSDRRWRCPANTQETLRGWVEGRPLTGTQIPEPKTPGEEVHGPQVLSPQGPQVSRAGLILGGEFGGGGTRGDMRHRGRPGREPCQDIQDKAGPQVGTKQGVGQTPQQKEDLVSQDSPWAISCLAHRWSAQPRSGLEGEQKLALQRY